MSSFTGRIASACQGPSSDRVPLEPPAPLPDVVDMRLEETATPPTCVELEREALFERRVLPLVMEGSEPSCARCYLPGVDFVPFVQEDECSTLACLQEEELISLEEPTSSKLLGWITRGHEVIQRSLEEDPVARAEHNAFLSWIQYHAQCGAERCVEELVNPCNKHLPPLDLDLGLPEGDATLAQDSGAVDQGDVLDMLTGGSADQGVDMEPDRMDMELPRCSEERLNFEFLEEIWPSHGRCYHCHSDRYRRARPKGQGPRHGSATAEQRKVG